MDWYKADHLLLYGSDSLFSVPEVQGGSNMTGTDLCVNKLQCTAAVQP